MAQRTQVVLIDDIDGKEITAGGQSVSFSLNGATWELDLSEKNAKRLADALQPFIEAGRKVGGRGARRAAAPNKQIDTKAVRAWAASNGIEVAARGRIPVNVVERYRAAGN
jgi:Lsr2